MGKRPSLKNIEKLDDSAVEKAVDKTVSEVAPNLSDKIQVFIVEFLLEMARTMLIAVMPILLSAFAIAAETGILTINWNMVMFAAILALLKGIDRALHESNIAKRGLTQF